ncbi:hypothetical protein GCM10011519_19400 [Marmoricola endophyticus]|uniref:HNH endonuclease n=1 Tax=Marmoricola endophyticus TaxID=2040280 RepID=A0A917F4I7_9ACTN|nr:hypothetical protein GCM10011519_19400 [Marmoricola endophyticus]
MRIIELALEWAHRHVIAPAEPEPRQVSHLERQPSGQGSESAIDTFERLGLPEIVWHAGASFATALGLSTGAGDTLLRDALVLSLRLPLVWDRVLAGQVPVWRARRVATAAVGAPRDVCTYLDQKTAPVAEKIGLAGLDKLIDAAMLDLYPEERESAQLEDLDKRFVKLDETSINHTGIAELVVRGDWADLSAFDATCSDIARLLGRAGEDGRYETFEARRSIALGVLADPARAAAMLADAEATGIASQRTRVFGLIAHLTETNLLNMNPAASDDQQRAWLIDVLHRWVGRSDLKVHVQGIVHCGGCADCDHDTTNTRTIRPGQHATHVDLDRYAPSSDDRAVVWARDPVCIFPWCDRPARRCDLDHREAFDHDHPADGGPTCPCNLAPLCRRHHRLKTHAGWTCTTIEPGVHLWTDRYGQSYLHTRGGTIDLNSS